MLPNLKIWLNHFEYHAQHPRRLPEGVSSVLCVEERRMIAASLPVAQSGHAFGGMDLLRAAYQYARLHDSAEVVRIIECVIREEHHHAFLIATFLRHQQIAPRREHWSTRLLQRACRRTQLDTALALLISAELLGIVYYRALEKGTRCQRLRLLCRIVVADELAHVGFAADLLMALRAAKPSISRRVSGLAHRTLFILAALGVWGAHRCVLRRAGYSLPAFLGACRAQHSFYLEPVMRPARVRLDEEATRARVR